MGSNQTRINIDWSVGRSAGEQQKFLLHIKRHNQFTPKAQSLKRTVVVRITVIAVTPTILRRCIVEIR